MHPLFMQEVAARHIAELHGQAARRRLVAAPRTGPSETARPRRLAWGRVRPRRQRPATT